MEGKISEYVVSRTVALTDLLHLSQYDAKPLPALSFKLLTVYRIF